MYQIQVKLLTALSNKTHQIAKRERKKKTKQNKIKKETAQLFIFHKKNFFPPYNGVSNS